MFKNYLLLVWRDFRKKPGFFLTNIFSLAIGLAACLLIVGYVRYHKSFDKQTSDYQNVYRIQYNRWSENDDKVQFASASPTIGPAIKSLIPATDEFARAYKAEGVFFYNDKFFKEEKVFRAESPIFSILGIKVINGTGATCLDDPKSIAISQSTARKYFGKDDPIGKTISYNKVRDLMVTAVFEDLPENMHIKADIFISLQEWIRNDPRMFAEGWFYSGFYTYVRFKHQIDTSEVNKSIAEYIDREFGKELKAYQMGMSFLLQPVSDIHLNSHFLHELEANGNETTMNILSIVGWFLLVIAWVNFINLTTIASIRNQKEIAIRKTHGAGRRQLLSQLLVWSASINLMAIIIMIALFELVHPAFCRFTQIPENAAVWNDLLFYFLIGVAFIVGTLSAGAYATSGVYSAAITRVLKGEKIKDKSSLLMKKGLVTLQFSIGIALIAATAGVYHQYKYITQMKPGFTLYNIITVNAPLVGDSTLVSRYKVFTDQVKNIPGVIDCSFSSVIPGQSNMFNRGGIYRAGGNENDSRNYRVTETGAGFFNTYNIRFIAGEGFSGSNPGDRSKVVLNACASRNLGFKSPQEAIGREIIMEGRPYIVSGVIIDFHQRSAKEAIEPQIFRYPHRFQGKFSINPGISDEASVIKKAGKIYTSVFPNNPFNASMLRDYYGSQFELEKQYTIVLILFSLLLLFITILGLIGLAAYTAEQRKKELGIRKTLGAPDGWLFVLVFKDYIVLALVASLIALPFFHYAFIDWLANFAQHITPGWWIYFLPVMVVIGVSVITVWIQTSKVINSNPIDNLKYE